MRLALLFLFACGGSVQIEEAPFKETKARLVSGSYFGAGSFSALVLGNVNRPFPAHWQIEDDTYIGSYPIVNSQPIVMKRAGDSLFDEHGEK